MKKKIVINENTLRNIIRESIVRLNSTEYFKNNDIKSEPINNDDEDNEEEQSFTNLKPKNEFNYDMEYADDNDMEFTPDMENGISCRDMIDEMDSIHYQNGCPWLLILDSRFNKITVCHNFDEFKEFFASRIGLEEYCYFTNIKGDPCIQRRYMVRGVSDIGEHYIEKYGEDDFERLLTVFILSPYHKRLEM
jgi:hypothetical protein